MKLTSLLLKLKLVIIKKDVFIVSTNSSNQSCIHDDFETLKDELDNFEFTEKEIENILIDIKKMKNKEFKLFSNTNFYSIKITKLKMTQNKIDNLPEFNGW